MSWTTPSDVTDAWIGEDAPDDEEQIQLYIDRAERLIRKAIPDIEDRLDEPEVDLLENVQSVVASMVERKFRNPDGTRQLSSTTGPFSEQRTYGGDEPGTLELLPSEIALLTLDGTGLATAFSIDLTPSTSILSSSYVPWWMA